MTSRRQRHRPEAGQRQQEEADRPVGPGEPEIRDERAPGRSDPPNSGRPRRPPRLLYLGPGVVSCAWRFRSFARHSLRLCPPSFSACSSSRSLNRAPRSRSARTRRITLEPCSDSSPANRLLLFNGRDGEWCAELAAIGRKRGRSPHRAPDAPASRGPDLHYLFAPLKRARLDYMAQKATELGVSALRPVITRHTVAERVKTERLRANAVEAAEQCGILRVPEVMEPEKLSRAAVRLGTRAAC